MTLRWFLFALFFGWGVMGCDESPRAEDGGGIDGGSAAGSDAGSSVDGGLDAGPSTGADAGNGQDAGVATDAGPGPGLGDAGMVAGDVLATLPEPVMALGGGADRLFALTASGRVWVLRPEGGRWSTREISGPTPELPLDEKHHARIEPVEVGDLTVLVVSTHLRLFSLSSRDEVTWTEQQLMIGSIWSMDVRATSSGAELVVSDEGDILDTGDVYLFQHDGTAWSSDFESRFAAEVGMDVFFAETRSSTPGPEIWFLTEVGQIYELGRDRSANPLRMWNIELERSAWDGVIRDVYRDARHELVFGSRYDNSFYIAHIEEDELALTSIFSGVAVTLPPTEFAHNMLEIAVEDVDPSSPGLEMMGVDDSGRAYLLRRDGEGWSPSVVHLESDRRGLYALLVDDFDPARPGLEPLVASETGVLRVLRP